MDADERTTLLRIAVKAQALLDRLDTLTTEAFACGGEREEREALRAALAATRTHCEACGGRLTGAEVAASAPQYYTNCETCQTSRF